MKRRAKEKTNLEQVTQVVLLSAADCAKLFGDNRCESSAGLNGQIGLLLWRLQGTLTRQERREGYRRLEALLSRKYPGGAIQTGTERLPCWTWIIFYIRETPE